MEPARSIGRLGFRRWYERQLTEGFAWLVTCLLCAVLIAAGIESIWPHLMTWRALAMLAFVYAVGLICSFALRRFLMLLKRAEQVASRSTCAQCGTNGRYEVLSETARMHVRCRTCAHEWTIP
jgi:DMSO/TMAO reductase YedYZ heme-binding membrane subunit